MTTLMDISRRTLFRDLARGLPAMVLLSNAGEPPGLLANLAVDTPHKGNARVRVALADFNSGSGFLPDLVEKANKTQEYYDFELIYLPFPTGAIVRDDFAEHPHDPRFYVPQLTDYLADAPKQLSVELLFGLTKYLIADEEESDLFTCKHSTNPRVSFISTFALRDFSKKAGVSFAKATFFLCICEILRRGKLRAHDTSVKLKYHPETVGCPLDRCDDRDDLIVGLKKMKFEHKECRDKVRDPIMLQAIDTLLTLELDSDQAKAEAGA
jgi:hypothetical protein